MAILPDSAVAQDGTSLTVMLYTDIESRVLIFIQRPLLARSLTTYLEFRLIPDFNGL